MESLLSQKAQLKAEKRIIKEEAKRVQQVEKERMKVQKQKEQALLSKIAEQQKIYDRQLVRAEFKTKQLINQQLEDAKEEARERLERQKDIDVREAKLNKLKNANPKEYIKVMEMESFYASIYSDNPNTRLSNIP